MEKKLYTYKVKGFTLIELIIAMILSSIVIVCCYYLITGLVHFQNKLTKDKNKMYDVSRLINQLQFDMQEAETLTLSRNGFMFRYENRITYYEFQKELVIQKQNEFTDSFFVTSKNLEHQFEAGEYLINRLSFKIETGNTVLPFTFIKYYPAKIKMLSFESQLSQ